jgi:uncharacterized membrane protein YdjX (TVP38/TMEM64 family)
MLASAVRLSVLATLLLGFIIVPFLLFGGVIESWTAGQLAREEAAALSAAIGIALLASDVILPIPSSLIGTALGAILGAPLGTLAGTIGLSAACVIGYVLGVLARPGVVEPLVAAPDRQLLETWLSRYGIAALILCRAVPVLAEASVIVAGAMRVSPVPALVATTLANLGISAVYAWVGSFASDAPTFLAAFLAAIAIPAGVLFAAHIARRGFANTG